MDIDYKWYLYVFNLKELKISLSFVVMVTPNNCKQGRKNYSIYGEHRNNYFRI